MAVRKREPWLRVWARSHPCPPKGCFTRVVLVLKVTFRHSPKCLLLGWGSWQHKSSLIPVPWHSPVQLQGGGSRSCKSAASLSGCLPFIMVLYGADTGQDLVGPARLRLPPPFGIKATHKSWRCPFAYPSAYICPSNCLS